MYIKNFIKNNKFIINFYLLLIFFIGSFYILLHTNFSHRYIAKNHPTIIAYLTGAVLRLVGQNPVIDGAVVRLGGFSYSISYHCSAVFGILIFTAAVLSFPATWKEKGVGLIIGIPVLDVINIIRLAALSLIGSRVPNLFDFFHEYLWQGVFIIFVIVLWLLWCTYIVKDKESQ